MTTLTINYRSIPALVDGDDGDSLYLPTPTFGAGGLNQHAGQASAVTAGDFYDAPDVIAVGKDIYGFVFWNVHRAVGAPFDGYQEDGHRVTISAPPIVGHITATAWYTPIGGIGQPGPPLVLTYGFDRSVNRWFRVAPIEAVKPAAAWKPGTRVVSTAAAAVDIDAVDDFDMKRGGSWAFQWFNGAVFDNWRMRGATVDAGDLQHVDQNTGGVAVATYQRVFDGHAVNAIPQWLIELLKGLRVIVDRPASDGPVDGPLVQPAEVRHTSSPAAVVRHELETIATHAQGLADAVTRRLKAKL